jgi:hypothetical protein
VGLSGYAGLVLVQVRRRSSSAQPPRLCLELRLRRKNFWVLAGTGDSMETQ